jgi:3-isopropylmalate/(R)-2-methylmalate dehydratase large subunit
MRIALTGRASLGVTPKDIVMELVRRIGADGATGYAVEFSGSVVSDMSVEGRIVMSIMIVEAGARGVVIAPDWKVLDYLRDRPRSPKDEMWERAAKCWLNLASDPEAVFHREVALDVSEVAPLVTWGTSPDQAIAVTDDVPDPEYHAAPDRKAAAVRALSYMGLTPGIPIQSVAIDFAFIGSCTNSRIEDLGDAAEIFRGRHVAHGVRAIVVPGSTQVRAQAEAEGIAKVFTDAGVEWRQSGCSMCLAMNDDVLKPGERCASSTNRNFEGRQGPGVRTHLMSPAMVAAAAVTGHITDVRRLLGKPRP